MAVVDYYKDPGYFVDLCFPYMLHFNQETFQKISENVAAPEDVTVYRGMIKTFGPYEESLAPFFYVKDGRYSFLLKQYMKQTNLFHFSFSNVMNLLADRDDCMQRFLEFYFDTQEPLSSLTVEQLSRMVDQLEVPVHLKYYIFQFLIVPDEALECLRLSLKKSELVLRRIYAQRSIKQQKLLENLNTDYLATYLSNKNRGMTLTADDIQGCTLLLLAKDFIQCVLHDDKAFLFLGCDYKQVLHFDQYHNGLPSLDSFGKVLSEANRIKILEILLDKGALCTAEIARLMGLSPTVMYYHLEMMSTAGMLLVKTIGRTMYYSINYPYFSQVKEMISRFIL